MTFQVSAHIELIALHLEPIVPACRMSPLAARVLKSVYSSLQKGVNIGP